MQRRNVAAEGDSVQAVDVLRVELVERAAEPAAPLRGGLEHGLLPDVVRDEVGHVGAGIPDVLDDREPARLEMAMEVREARMEPRPRVDREELRSRERDARGRTDM